MRAFELAEAAAQSRFRGAASVCALSALESRVASGSLNRTIPSPASPADGRARRAMGFGRPSLDFGELSRAALRVGEEIGLRVLVRTFLNQCLLRRPPLSAVLLDDRKATTENSLGTHGRDASMTGMGAIPRALELGTVQDLR
jgi:hypothetical protein